MSLLSTLEVFFECLWYSTLCANGDMKGPRELNSSKIKTISSTIWSPTAQRPLVSGSDETLQVI